MRLHPQAGDKQTLNLTMKIAMDIQIAGMPGQTMKLPTIRMAMDTTVKSVSPDGGILYDLTIGNAEATAEADANPQMAQLMKSVLWSTRACPAPAPRRRPRLLQGDRCKCRRAPTPNFARWSIK